MSTPKDKDFQIGLTKKTELYVRVIVPQGKINSQTLYGMMGKESELNQYLEVYSVNMIC